MTLRVIPNVTGGRRDVGAQKYKDDSDTIATSAWSKLRKKVMCGPLPRVEPSAPSFRIEQEFQI
jgi:hypothetical protein